MRLSNNKMGQRGVTLVELVIVLALVAIISTSVVLLCNSISAIVVSNQKQYYKIESLTLTREFVDKWFHNFDEKESIYECKNYKLVIINNGVEYTIRCVDENIEVDYPSDSLSPNKLVFKGIKDIKFENNDLNNRIYKCTILFVSDEEDVEYSFLISRRS